MSARYETPLLLDAKIEELKIWGKKNINSVSFVQCKPKTRGNKIHAPVTTWPQEQFFNLLPILTHRRFFKQTSQRFSSKKTCEISNLNKSLRAGNHVYLNCSAFLALQTDWWVRDMNPITCWCQNRRTENLREKNIKSVSFVQCKPKTRGNKIHAPVTTWPQEQFFNLLPISTHRRFFKQTSPRFSSKKTCEISNLNKSLIAGNHVYLNCSAFLALQTDWWVQDMRPHYSSTWK